MSKNIGELNGNYKHGKSNIRLYGIWGNMLYRCNTKTCDSYGIYGGKGINVCNEWFDFERFYQWSILNGYKDNLTIDRIDSNKNYEPQNCQWITKSENTIKANKTKQHRRANNGTYYGISPDGYYYEFENANVFAKQHDLNSNVVRAVANKIENRTHHKKWKFGFVCDKHI